MKRALLLCGIAALSLSCGEEEKNPCSATTSSVCTVMGDGTAGYRAGSALKSRLYLPMDALFGPDGRMYVTDWNNHRVRAVDLSGGDVEDIAGSGYLGDGASEPALEANLNHPTGMAFDPEGRLLIAAWHNSRIKMVDPVSGKLLDTCGTGTRAYGGDEGPASAAVLDLPASIAFSPDHELFVLDQANQVIRKIDGEGNIHRVAGQCVTVAPCGAEELPAACPAPSGKSACLSAADACTKPCKPGFAEGSALEIRMWQQPGQMAPPGGRLAFAPDGSLLFSDSGNHLIRRIDLATGEVTVVAGKVKDDRSGGQEGNAPDHVPAVGAEINTPVDLEVDKDGTVYFTDRENSCVRAVRPDGTMDVIAGVCGKGGFNGDGKKPRETLLDRPFGLTLHDGSLYVVDTYNQRVRQVVLE